MNEAERVLVVILASFLALNLLLAVLVLIKLLQISNTIKRITAKAESVADKVDGISGLFAKTAAPAAIGRLLVNLFKVAKGRKSKAKRRHDDE